MNDIKPIELTQTITTIKGWECFVCGKTYEDQDAARHHRASHSYTKSEWLMGETLYYFQDEQEFNFWRRWGLYHRDGGCSGAWDKPGWYLIHWRGEDNCEYPTLEPAWDKLNLKLENAKYEYEQAREKMEAFKKLLGS